MENIIFTFAYIMLLIWGLAIISAISSTILNLFGVRFKSIALEVSNIRQSIRQLIRGLNAFKNKKLEIPSYKRYSQN
jgi:hypothetical protein